MPQLKNGFYLDPLPELQIDNQESNHIVTQMMQVFAAAGWTCVDWSDGTTYHNDGSFPAIDAMPVGASWINIKAKHADNSLGDKHSWCWILLAYDTVVLKHSRSDGFSGGGAATVPTAGDQEFIIGSSDTVGDRITYGSTFGTYFGLYCACDGDTNGFVAGYFGTNGDSGFGWFFDPLVGADDYDDFPYTFGAYGIAPSYWTTPISNPHGWFAYHYDSGVPGYVLGDVDAWEWWGGGRATPYNLGQSQIVGAPSYDIFPILYGNQATDPYPRPKGWGTMLHWLGPQVSGIPYLNLIDWGTDPADANGLMCLDRWLTGPWSGSSVNLAHIGAWTELGGGTKLWDRPSVSVSFLMRGYDGTLGKQVYWTSTTVDSSGSSYTGPGPLSRIKVYARLSS